MPPKHPTSVLHIARWLECRLLQSSRWTSLRWVHSLDTDVIRRFNIFEIVWSNNEHLASPVYRGEGDIHESLQRQRAGILIEKHVVLVKNAEWTLSL